MLLDSTIVIYYNCYKLGHIAPSCLELYRGDLKEIKEELYNNPKDKQLGNKEP